MEERRILLQMNICVKSEVTYIINTFIINIEKNVQYQKKKRSPYKTVFIVDAIDLF